MRKLLITLLVLFSITSAFAQRLGDLQKVEANGEVINIQPYYTAPGIYDHDKDGLDDLIIGVYEGQFRFYKNVGTKKSPKYDGFSHLISDGEEIKVPNW